jgi:signal transduction histidine kinase
MLWRGDEAGVGVARRGAFIIGGSYLIISACYIVTSGYIVHAISSDMAELAWLEQVKGLGFICLTALYLGVLSHRLLSQLWKQGQALVQQREALLRAEHRATSGLLASSLAHDFNNVLVSLRLGVEELVSEELNAREREELCGDLRQALEQGGEMTQKLLKRVRDQGTSQVLRAELDVARLAREAVEMARPLARQRRVSMSLSLDEAPALRADREVLCRALANLLVNAVEAAGEGGRVVLHVRTRDGRALLEVHDSGPGFSPDALARLTEPFFTTKATGTGLGLFSVRLCAEQHGGALELDRSSELGGACARIVI